MGRRLTGLNTYGIHGADVASATTINLNLVTGELIDVTGTTDISTVTLADGAFRIVRFTGILNLVHSSSFILPTSANITTEVGDFAELRGYASGVVRLTNYSRLSGASLVSINPALSIYNSQNFF